MSREANALELTCSGNLAVHRTERLELRIGVTAIPIADPVVLAETSIDALAAFVAERRHHVVDDALECAACIQCDRNENCTCKRDMEKPEQSTRRCEWKPLSASSFIAVARHA